MVYGVLFYLPMLIDAGTYIEQGVQYFCLASPRVKQGLNFTLGLSIIYIIAADLALIMRDVSASFVFA